MKAVFIDGINFHHMGHALGIARFNFAEVYKFLTENVGAAREHYEKPFVTVTPAMPKGVAGLYRSAGFEVLETTSSQSADDMAIVQRINALDPAKVTEIVLVSADQDYISALRSKAQQGIKVWWVGTSTNGSLGTPFMSAGLQPFFGTEFTFVDITPYKDKLTGLPKKMPPIKTKVPVRNLKIELSGANSHDEYLAIVSSITRILRKRPHMKYKLEG